MLTFFLDPKGECFALQSLSPIGPAELDKLRWLLSGAEPVPRMPLPGPFVGPRPEMVTPWSTNAVEICQNMGIDGIQRLERFTPLAPGQAFDPMLTARYDSLHPEIFDLHREAQPILPVLDIAEYNRREGLALSPDEVDYLQEVSRQISRPLTDSEVFGFSQVNSEHCRHKIFNGSFVLDGQEMPESLFSLIKRTTRANPNRVVSAYKDNVAFLEGPTVWQFAPRTQHQPDFFEARPVETVISLKAETHNFPTTVEPFNGAATGAGGEIRDRMAGGKGSIPLAGTAVYMTSYPRLSDGRPWEETLPARPWLYQSPLDILIKASDGASDFGNKFGQPLIAGSLLTFEHREPGRDWGYDKVIMLAGGIGYGKRAESLKDEPQAGDLVVVMGGDNYRIGMGGGAVSSVATGQFSNSIELNAVQRSNPEMQKRVANVVRALVEMPENPLVSIHDHGAGGHLNALSELVEATGGTIDMGKLPIGDPTLSDKEIIGNESQERMGLVVRPEHWPLLSALAERERAPLYAVGQATGDMHLRFARAEGQHPLDLDLGFLFGKPPRTVLNDKRQARPGEPLRYPAAPVEHQLEQVLRLEAVACKDWLTNKVDRSVTGRVAMQQCAGQTQIPVNNLGIMALDFSGTHGVATAIGHAPAVGLVSPAMGSLFSVLEALSNIVWAPLEGGLRGVSLSANWMWPCRNPGEDARLYEAVEAMSDFCVALGVNIPTGKDSLSMKQKYDGQEVLSPGTVIVSAAGQVANLRAAVSVDLKPVEGSRIYYLAFSDGLSLAGSSFAQTLGQLGQDDFAPVDPGRVAATFGFVQEALAQGWLLAGHDVGSGGLVTSLLEMLFTQREGGARLDLGVLGAADWQQALFCEKPALVMQSQHGESLERLARAHGLELHFLGEPTPANGGQSHLELRMGEAELRLDVARLRRVWFRTSALLDARQSGAELAQARFDVLGQHGLEFHFPERFSGKLSRWGLAELPAAKPGSPVAAIIREKGVNGDREMAYAMHLAGFAVKDVHMTDLMGGREDLSGVRFLVFVGGFSNSDVLGSAKGWAGAFRYNDKARQALEAFYARPDTLSLGVCNGCQLMMELGLVFPELGDAHPRMRHNASGKFESGFVNLDILPNDSVMLGSLSGSRLGIWVAHGEGRFALDGTAADFGVVGQYSHKAYPWSPNGSDHHAACLVSRDGRHLAMMPHLERSILPWQWPHYPHGRQDEATPWLEAFTNARDWLLG